MRIISFEKPAIEESTTPVEISRFSDFRRLNLDGFEGGKNMAKTTSRPSSPLLSRQASRTNLLKQGL